MTVSNAVPVTVLTGFLGAGKTTLLNRLLRLPALSGTAVLVNEFGLIGVDHLLVERVEGDMLLLTTGCLCCAARGDLVSALQGLFEKRERGHVAFDRIIVETTGLADPGPVLNALLPAGGSATCRLDRLITVVDALDGREILDRFEEARRQVALADLLVLSKTDGAAGSDLPALRSLKNHLASLNPWAAIFTAQQADSIFSATMSMPASPLDRPTPHRHGHDHLDGIRALSLTAGSIDPKTLERFLDRLLKGHGTDLLRLKGFVATDDDPDRPILVNVVQHRIHPAAKLDAWPDRDRTTRIVVIARSQAAEAVADLWAAFFGPPRIDQPDAAALALEPSSGLF